jgi:hypothetical protein
VFSTFQLPGSRKAAASKLQNSLLLLLPWYRVHGVQSVHTSVQHTDV